MESDQRSFVVESHSRSFMDLELLSADREGAKSMDRSCCSDCDDCDRLVTASVVTNDLVYWGPPQERNWKTIDHMTDGTWLTCTSRRSALGYIST